MYSVTKDNGSKELLQVGKISKAVEWACEGITGVSSTDIEVDANIHFYDGIHTKEIRSIVLQTAKNKSSLKAIGYDKVAARLEALEIRKEAYGISKSEDFTSIKEIVENGVKSGIYSKELLGYTQEEYDLLDGAINHNRDYDFSSIGIFYLRNKYAIKRKNIIQETPQVIYMTIAMVLRRSAGIEAIISFYNDLSTFKISLPSPAMTVLRTGSMDIASCIKIRTGDSLDSWNEASKATILHTASSAGVGDDIAEVASIGDMVKGGKIKHAGKVPLLRKFNADIASAIQNGRVGSGSAFINFFDPEIISILGLPSPRTEVNKRINELSYGIKVNQLVYDRAKANKQISLFSSRVNKDLLDKFYSSDVEAFTELYERLEDEGLATDTISARDLLKLILEARVETGKYYILNIDEVNRNTPYKEPIVQSNICMEIAQPTKALSSDRPNSPDIGVCILTNVNMGKVSKEELSKVVSNIVFTLNDNIGRQKHPTSQANAFVEQYASLGVGLSNMAYFFAKNGVRYGSEEALQLQDEYMEHFAYSLYMASVEYAKCNGRRVKKFSKTTMVDGELLIDRWSDAQKSLVNRDLVCDWDGLKALIAKYGMANTSLSAIPPSETSSVIGNQTSSLNPIKDLVTVKDSSGSVVKQFAPEAIKLAGNYDFVFDNKTVGRAYLKHMAVAQKWIHQAISIDTYYNPELYEDKKIPIKDMLSDLYFCKEYGIKSNYYNNIYMADELTSAEICTNCQV